MAYGNQDSSGDPDVEHCQIIGRELTDPCICYWSTGFMWVSVFAFLSAGTVVVTAGLKVIA
jgi:hypothetical protein